MFWFLKKTGFRLRIWRKEHEEAFQSAPWFQARAGAGVGRVSFYSVPEDLTPVVLARAEVRARLGVRREWNGFRLHGRESQVGIVPRTKGGTDEEKEKEVEEEARS